MAEYPHTCCRLKLLKEKIAPVRQQMRELKTVDKQLARSPDRQVSLTDPDARSMATSGRGTGMVGYNVQTAIDTDHRLIVAYDVVNQGHDRRQLAPMAKQAEAATGGKRRGYWRTAATSAASKCANVYKRVSPRSFPSRRAPVRGPMAASTSAILSTTCGVTCTDAPAGEYAIRRFTALSRA